jgi:hypothetical protein
MSVPDLEPSLAALLRVEREGAGIPPDAKAALWTRLERSIALPPPASPPSPRPPGAGGGLDAAGFFKANALRVVLSVLAIAAGVAAFGVVARPADPGPASGSERRPPPSASVFETTAAAPAASASYATSADSAPILQAPSRTPPHAVRPRPPSDDDLARERALIEAARAAIHTGGPAQGIDKLDEHARSFPNGRMSEERDALRVFALRASGHDVEANAAAEAFRSRYPHSLLLGSR